MTGDARPLLRIRGVKKTFGAVTALRSADLEVLPGEVHALMGANGAGKSTLVKIITGVFPADAGEMDLMGRPAVFRSPAEARKAGIVSVYQDPAIVPDLTVAQNMRLARVPLDAVKAAMRRLGVERVDLSSVARRLDFAVLRLIDLARALASNPQVLMLDEITAALPADLSERVFEVVRDFRDRGSSVIFISHRLAEVVALCDRATVLRDGVTVGVTSTRGAEETIVNLMLGSDVAKAATSPVTRARPREAARETPALEVEGLTYRHTLRGVSFRVGRGEVLGVAALEGQGQEELFNCIAGVHRADAGEVRAEGRALRLRHPADAIEAGLVLVPANRLLSLLPQRSVQENVALAAFRAASRLGADSDRRREAAGRRRGAEAANRHAGGGRGAPPQRRQHAEGRDRALDRGRLQDAALFRPDARDRHRHQAADLRALARGRRTRRLGALVHLGIAGDPPRLRPRDRPLRGQNLGRNGSR